MMRAFFIAACVLSLIYIVAAIGIADEVRSAYYSSYDYRYDSYDSYGYDSYSSYHDYGNDADDYSRMGGIVSVFYMLISAGAFVLALMKIKTQTMKVISIIGMSISGLFFLWALMPLASPGAISFDEIAPAFVLGTLALLSLHIVGIVHAFKTST